MTSTTTPEPIESILDLYGLAGSVAIVTGAGSGLGDSPGAGRGRGGYRPSRAGAGVQLDTTARPFARRVGLAWWSPTDVTQPDACAELAEAALAEFGRVDVLVNNAGVSHVAPADFGTAAGLSGGDRGDLMGAYWAAQACARIMQPGASIVNVSSMLGW